MIVLDASAVVELLTNGPAAPLLREELAARDETAIAPHVLDVEVMSAVRNLLRGHRLDAHDCRRILTELASLPVERYAHTPLLSRIWELRHNFTPYDAVYIALAEETAATLVTCDAALAKGHRAKVRVIGS